MSNLWYLIEILRLIVLVIAFDIRPDITKYCRDKDRLIGSEENDYYLLVDAEVNTTILLECHFW